MDKRSPKETADFRKKQTAKFHPGNNDSYDDEERDKVGGLSQQFTFNPYPKELNMDFKGQNLHINVINETMMTNSSMDQSSLQNTLNGSEMYQDDDDDLPPPNMDFAKKNYQGYGGGVPAKSFQSDEEFVDSYISSLNQSEAEKGISKNLKKKKKRSKKDKKKRSKKDKKKRDKKDKRKGKKRKKGAIRIEITTRKGVKHKYKIDPKILADPKKLKIWLEQKCADKE